MKVKLRRGSLKTVLTDNYKVYKRFNNEAVDMRETRGQFGANLSPRSSYDQM